MELFYKNFIAKIYFSSETDSFFGEVIHDSNLISFQATQLMDLEVAMREAIDRYIRHMRL